MLLELLDGLENVTFVACCDDSSIPSNTAFGELFPLMLLERERFFSLFEYVLKSFRIMDCDFNSWGFSFLCHCELEEKLSSSDKNIQFKF